MAVRLGFTCVGLKKREDEEITIFMNLKRRQILDKESRGVLRTDGEKECLAQDEK